MTGLDRRGSVGHSGPRLPSPQVATVGLDGIADHSLPAAAGTAVPSSPLVADIPPNAGGLPDCPNCLLPVDDAWFCVICGRQLPLRSGPTGAQPGEASGGSGSVPLAVTGGPQFLPPKSTAPAGIHSRGTGRGEEAPV